MIGPKERCKNSPKVCKTIWPDFFVEIHDAKNTRNNSLNIRWCNVIQEDCMAFRKIKVGNGNWKSAIRESPGPPGPKSRKKSQNGSFWGSLKINQQSDGLSGSHRSTRIASDLASRALASQAKPQRESESQAFRIARS